MKNLALLNTLFLHCKAVEKEESPSQSQNDSGYTLLELLVVVLIIATLATIAVPGWLGFLSQRRVTAANSTVLQALQEAQSQAKARKVSYSVSVRINTNQAQIAVYPTKNPITAANIDPSTNLNPSVWKKLSDGQIWVGTNSTTNTASSSISAATATPTTATITFDYLGTLAATPPDPDPNLGTGQQGLIIAVAAAQPGNPSQPIPSTTKCVSVTTLLGSIRTGKVNPNTPAVPCRS